MDTAGYRVQQEAHFAGDYLDEPSVDFDYNAIRFDDEPEPNPEPGVPMSDVAAALSIILQWVNEPCDIRHVGARSAVLLAYLNPAQARHGRDTLTAIAAQVGLTKAALSKVLMEFRDEVGVHLTMGKRGYARDRYSRSQHAAVAMGSHSSIAAHQHAIERKLLAEELAANG